LLLSVLMALAISLSGCAEKSGGGSAEPAGGESSGGSAAPAASETVKTAETKEDAKKLADAFYGGLAKANPVSMTSFINGTEASTFMASGDTFCLVDPSSDITYYMFIEDGKKYFIGDGETAYEDEYMYDMFSESLESTLQMFVTGIYDVEDDGALQFSAKQTDKTENGAVTSKLVSVITGEEDGKAATMTVTGTARNGTVSSILYEAEAGGEKESAEFKFSYDNISIDLPAYTIGESYGGYSDITLEGEHVDSPYRTLDELIATLGEDDYLLYTMEDDRVYAVGEKDGRQYQFSAVLSAEDMEAYEALDFFSDTYNEDVYAILGKLTVDDCVDFTGCIVPQDELDAFAGKTVQDLVDAGYENTGWSVFEGDAMLTFDKDLMEYEAKVTPTDGFDENSDFDFEDMLGFRVEQFRFSAPEYAALPIR